MKQIFEWLNYNSIRKFPLYEENIENKVLTDGVIVDANITVPDTVDLPIYIGSILVNNAIAAVSIKDANDNTIGVATGNITDEYYNPLYIEPLIDILSGVIVIGPDAINIPQNHGMQKHTFTLFEGELEERCVTVTQASVLKSITVNGIKLTGDIKFVAGTDVKLRYSETEPNCIVAEITNPLNFVPECLEDCSPDKCNNAILSINGVCPDSSGNILITGDGAVVPDNISADQLINIDTPALAVQDFCDKDRGKPGRPGPPGDPGADGPPGIYVCEEADCFCQVCDTENPNDIADCDTILES